MSRDFHKFITFAVILSESQKVLNGCVCKILHCVWNDKTISVIIAIYKTTPESFVFSSG